MKKVYLFLMLMLISSAFAICQVTVTFSITGATSINVPPAGLSNVNFTIKLSKPSAQVTDGLVFIYAKGGNSGATKLNYQGSVLQSSWVNNEVSLLGSFSINPSQLNNQSGVVFAQYESSTGVNYKSSDIAATIPIANNTVTPPSITSFFGSGDPAAIVGSTPTGGTGSYTYQWQSSTTSATSGFNNIASATSLSYDPPTISQTTHYRRSVTSGSISSTSNVVTITIIPFPPISNNSISNSGSSVLFGASDPALLNGSIPSGGTGSYAYQWQSSTTSTTTGFNNILSATNQNFDPPIITQTTYYRRLVNSGGLSSTSNVITITIRPIGSTFESPINIGNLDICSIYGDGKDPRGYGNEFGLPSDDIFYRFNLVRLARVSLSNCKPAGTPSVFYLLDANGNYVQGGMASPELCDVGGITDFDLQPGVYYVVAELADTWTAVANFNINVSAIVSTSPDVTISAGTSTTLTASGGDSYTWEPATGLNTTTGSSVIASPSISTTYLVRANSINGCTIVKYIRVTVNGAVGSTINNPIVANVGICRYSSPVLYMNGYGNDYGGPLDDIFFRFTLSNSSTLNFYVDPSGYLGSGRHLVLLDQAGVFISEKYFGWMDSGDDAGTYYYGELDGTPFNRTLQPGTYFLVVETQLNEGLIVHITPSSSSCRERTDEARWWKTEPEQKKIANNETATIYPNPANKDLSLGFLNNDVALVQFVNANGIVVKEVTIQGTTLVKLSTDDLPTGLYLVRIKQGEKIITKKVLIER